MRVLFVGDVFATPGYRAACAFLERVRDEYDFVVVNGENAAGGFGITRKHFEGLRDAGADVVTLGNHTFDQGGTSELLDETRHLLRAANYPPGTPGAAYARFEARNGQRITVAQVMGRVFMDPLDDPFRSVDAVVEATPPEETLLVEVHAEATSEKKVLGYHLAGRASAVLGTHTHVQTADECLFRGTAYLTDVGMSGVQNSSIGMAFKEVHHRFVHKTPRRFRPAEGRATVCAVAMELDGRRALEVRRLQWEEEPPS